MVRWRALAAGPTPAHLSTAPANKATSRVSRGQHHTLSDAAVGRPNRRHAAAAAADDDATVPVEKMPSSSRKTGSTGDVWADPRRDGMPTGLG